MMEFHLDSAGAGTIRCGVWEPEGEPRAVVQLVHGIAEHIGRYDDFAQFLTAHGFLVAAEDHMGHGGSISDTCGQGYFSGGWEAAVTDVHSLTVQVRSRYPALPYVLMGHSMGSFLARTFLFQYPNSGLSAVILSGTGRQNPAVLSAGLAICRREARRYGETGHSPLIQKLIFGAYNRQFLDARTPNDWICSVHEVVDAYEADPLCGFMPTVGLARELLRGIQMIQKRSNLVRMRRDLPVLFFSGALDPVGANGAGVRRAAQAFRSVGMQDVTCKLYPNGRHEMLNEANRQEVYEDVLNWIESKL